MKWKRMLSALLVLVLLLSCLSASVLAADTVQTSGQDSFFYFSAEAKGKLLIAPTKIYFSDDQTIREALYGSNYSFQADTGSAFITAIEGTAGSFTYGSAPNEVKLDDKAAKGICFRFSEAENSAPSEGLQKLMQVMADYLEEDADVQNAAKEKYQAAVNGYPGVSSENAQSFADAITDAITAYENSLSAACNVTFSGFSGEDYTVSAVNAYGKTFTDSNHTGSLQLPSGNYTFYVRQDNRMVSGAITVSESMTVKAGLPTGSWFDEDSLKISSGYSAEFEDNCYSLSLNDHVATVQVPDSFTGRLYPYFVLSSSGDDASVKAIYTNAAGKSVEKAIPAESMVTGIDSALSRGAQGNTVILRAEKTGEDGYTQSMDLTLQLDRMPTLESLRVTNSAGTAQASSEGFSATTTNYTYKILNSVTELRIYPIATVSESSICVNGTELSQDGSAAVKVDGETRITVSVSSGGYMTSYILTIQPGEGRNVTFNTDVDTTLSVVNKNGEELAYTRTVSGKSKASYLYTLVPGEEYSYVATKGTYYHAKRTFTLDDATTVFSVTVKQEDWLTGLSLGSGQAAGYKGTIELSPAFSGSTHSYTAEVPDSSGGVYAWVSTQTADTSGSYACTALYRALASTQKDGTEQEKILTADEMGGTYLSYALLRGNADENTLTFRVSGEDDGVTYYTDYLVTLKRTLRLEKLEITYQNAAVTLNRKSSSDTTGFSSGEQSYSILIPAAAAELQITCEPTSGSSRYGTEDRGYEITVNGTKVAEDGTVSTALNGTENNETITIIVTNRNCPEAETVYTVEVQKTPQTDVSFRLTPSDTLVYIYENVAGNRIWPQEDGTYAISEGFTYTCTLTRSGYVSKSGTLQLVSQNGEQAMQFAEAVYTDLTNVEITLKEAEKNTTIKNLDAEWPDFRGDSSNNGVTDAKTPVTAEDGMLYWASQIGSGYGTGAVSSPILIDNCLIVYAGQYIYRVNKDTGEVEKKGEMAATSSFAVNGPTYADGMVLVGLKDGRVQAFDAVTLESLWIYQDPLGGQALCPITVHNGYAYTGFWNAETEDAGFACISLTDENPENTEEPKAASWRLVQKGGFYWAGAYVCDDFIMIGTDDGTSDWRSDSAYLYLLDPLTGEVLDSQSGLHGDIRSTIVYDEKTDAYYFTSKGGRFYRVKVQNRKIAACTPLELKNGIKDEAAMSTSTPVISNGRAYVGVSGSSQFGVCSGHNITVIDLNEWKIAYSVPTKGYPQTSGLLTTAYEDTGYVYVYFFENYTPGTLRVLRDKAGQTSADTAYVTQEVYTDDSGNEVSYQAAYGIFTPTGLQAQYAICSPIADSNGTIYFKNDSGYLMAFGRSIKGISVKTNPDKMHYAVGDTFDPTGMVVTATLSDGTERDVTGMVTASQESLSEGTEEITLQFGYGQTMYRNQIDDGRMTGGHRVAPITATLQIQVGDLISSGNIAEGITWSFTQPSNVLTVSGNIPEGYRVFIAGYDKNGKMTSVKLLTGSGSVTLPDSIKIRIFYLNQNYSPIRAAVEVLG